MSSQLDAIRKLRDAVVKRVDEQDTSKIPFKKWMRLASKAVEDITGMEVDILPEVPWKDWYNNGTDPVAAASMALQSAEEEDDTFDAKKYLGDDSDNENDLENEIGFGENEVKLSSLRKRSFNVESREDDGFASLYDLMEGLDMMKSCRPKRRRLVEIAEQSRVKQEVIEEDLQEEEEDREEDVSDSDNSVIPEAIQDAQDAVRPLSDVDRAVAAVKAVEAAELAHKEAGEGLKEASVQGGDWGRWSDATKVAGEVGTKLADIISKATEEKYKFGQEGSASSAKGGSELWFGIRSEKSTDNNYYLGFKIRDGEKGEKPEKWDIILSKGAGLGSAKTVSKKEGVKTSKLKSELEKLANSAKSEPSLESQLPTNKFVGLKGVTKPMRNDQEKAGD